MEWWLEEHLEKSRGVRLNYLRMHGVLRREVVHACRLQRWNESASEIRLKQSGRSAAW